ncbi:hypothetical protein JHK82_039656 [Glycine max]|nr:hypothetical protein JHK85_040428 [Glycine max]KAG5110433.1 hypothetical protein JHK82_039656 [Glycine max]
MAIPIPSTNYAKLARVPRSRSHRYLKELVVNPRIFFGLCCKDWGTHGDLRYVSCSGHWCSQALILIEIIAGYSKVALFVAASVYSHLFVTITSSLRVVA